MTVLTIMLYRKVCQPELDSVSQVTSMPKLSSTNLIWKEVTEETAKVCSCQIIWHMYVDMSINHVRAERLS